MKFILRYMKPFVLSMIFGVTLKFMGTFTDLFLPSLLEYLIDDVVPTKNVRMIVICGAAMLALSLSGYFLNIVANRMASRVARDAGRKIRHDLFSRTLELSCADADKFSVASLESRLTSDTYNIHHMIGMIQRIGIRAPILLIGGIIVTLFMEPVLTLVLIAMLPLIYFVVRYVSGKGVKLYKALQEAADEMVRIVRENSLGVRVIKALSRQKREAARFDNVNSELTAKEKRAGEVMAVSNPVISFFLNIGLVLIVLVGAYRVHVGVCEAGKILAFMNYFTMISNALLSITRIFVMLSKGTASAGRIEEVINAPQKAFEVYGLEKKTDAYIKFENVSFAYGDAEGEAKGKNAVEDISFELKKGQTLGIIGGTGSGKSTIINLLVGFYEPCEGRIYIDGKSVGAYEKDKFRELFGIATQNPFLYSETIRENIDFGRNLTDASIEKAADIAQASAFIAEKENCYDFMLNSKGNNLSGGQKQRLIISRAVAAEPQILILDDSQSALDYRTDANLRRELEAMDGNKNDKTTKIIVAQRVSSVMGADLIIVLDNGRIVSSGTHDELVEKCEIYSEISKTQMGGAVID